MKKKILIGLAVLLAVLALTVALPAAEKVIRGRYGTDLNGETVFFDSRVSSHITALDFKMSKEGYKIENKVVDSRSETGADDIQPHNGVNMRLLRVISHYSKPVEVTSHGKTAYQRLLGRLEGAVGRLPGVFYALDLTKYEGERTEKTTETTVESVFLLLEDKKDRVIGGGYFAYGGTMQRIDEYSYRELTEEGELLEERTERKIVSTPHFEGDLDWLKNKAYNNYVSYIELTDAFEVLE